MLIHCLLVPGFPELSLGCITVSSKTEMLPEGIIARKGKVAWKKPTFSDVYSTFLLCRVSRRNISPNSCVRRLSLGSHQDQINT